MKYLTLCFLGKSSKWFSCTKVYLNAIQQTLNTQLLGNGADTKITITVSLQGQTFPKCTEVCHLGPRFGWNCRKIISWESSDTGGDTETRSQVTVTPQCWLEIMTWAGRWSFWFKPELTNWQLMIVMNELMAFFVWCISVVKLIAPCHLCPDI